MTDEFGIPLQAPSKPLVKAKKDKHAAQPFNIGKYSRVAKASTSELALSDNDADVDPPTKPKAAKAPRKPRASAAKAKAAPKPRAKVETSYLSEDLDAVNDEFAMDSDEEERQLKAAIQMSAARGVHDKFASETSTEVNSRASSAVPSRKGGRSTAASTPSTGRISRVAAIRSAESELVSQDRSLISSGPS